MRTLLKEAVWGGNCITTEYELIPILPWLVSFDDPAWSDWIPYDPDPEGRTIRYDDLPARDELERPTTYVFAVQARDAAGAESRERTLGRNVRLFRIDTDIRPQLVVDSPELERIRDVYLKTSASFDIPPGYSPSFVWAGSAERYFGTVAGYR